MAGLRSSSWVWLLALFTIAGFIEAAFWSQLTSFTPLYLRQLGITGTEELKAWTGAIASISTFVGLPFLPFWGALADRYSRKPVIIRSFVAHLLAGVLAMLAGNAWVFLMARSVQTFSLGNSGLMMTTLSELVPTKRMGLAFSIMNGAAPLGAFLGPLVGGPVIDSRGFPALLALDSVLMLGVIIALSVGYTDHFVGHDRGPLLRMAVNSVGIILSSPRLRLLFPALFVLFAGWMLAFTYVPLAVAELYRGTEPGTAIGIVVGVGGLSTLIISPVVGALADHFGHWRVLFAGATLAALLWPLPAIASEASAESAVALALFAAAWAIVNGIVSAVFALSFSVLSSSASADIRGRVMAFAYLPVNMGFAVGPAVGAVVTRVSVLNALPIMTVFPVAGVLTLLGTGMLALAVTRR